MKNTVVRAFLFCTLLPMSFVLPARSATRENLNLRRGEQLFSTICKAQTTPVSFVYGGTAYHGLGRLRPVSREIVDAENNMRRATLVYALDDKTRVRVEAALCKEYGQTEYTLWFENVGTEPTEVLEHVKSADIYLPGGSPLVRGCLGDHVNKYAPYERGLLKDTVSFRSDGGRATHVNFPYFDLVHGNGGTLIALGWAGTWQADFVPRGKGVNFTAQNCNDFRSVLMPG